ncbi:MAG: hypothetical protein ACFBZ8_04560 [Opitutales bacterium]
MRTRVPDTHFAHFEHLLPPAQEWFRPAEVARIIGRTDQFVRNCFDNQKILGHTYNSRAPRGRERRRAYQIHRDALLLYLLETANYEPPDFVDRLRDIIAHRSPTELLQIDRAVHQTLRLRDHSELGSV